MDWQRFDWPAAFGEPDQAWFGYLLDRGWTVSPVPTVTRVGAQVQGHPRRIGTRSGRRIADADLT